MKKMLLIVAVLLVLVATFATVKRVSPLSWGLWGTTNTNSGIALQGFDAVSYFLDSGPPDGSLERSDTNWAKR